MRPVEQRPPLQANPGASRSRLDHRPGRRSRHPRQQRGAHASAEIARHGQSDHAANAGSGLRPRVEPHRGPGASKPGRSKGCRGRNGCTAPPARGTSRKETCGLDGPYAPRSNRRCWTDSSQRATLAWHRLHRHGVGRGTVIELPGRTDRCRAHLLRQQRVCTLERCPRHGPVSGLLARHQCHTHPITDARHRRHRQRHAGRPAGRPAWQGTQQPISPATASQKDQPKIKSDTSPANRRGS